MLSGLEIPRNCKCVWIPKKNWMATVCIIQCGKFLRFAVMKPAVNDSCCIHQALQLSPHTLLEAIKAR